MKSSAKISAERWTEAQRILEAALELPAELRMGHVVAECGDDAELRELVERLLRACLAAEKDSGFLQVSAAEFAASIVSDVDSADDIDDGDSILEQLRAALPERYAIEREAGRGGMATVFLAQDSRHSRRVALKVMRPRLVGAASADRFLREIRIAARLSHPHILPLHDSGEAGALLYYVTPYLEGESLRARLVREGPLPIGDAIRFLRELASALSYAHRQGIIHRDIKPENVLLQDGHAVLADFGIAGAIGQALAMHDTERALSGGTNTSALLGTPAYMAPEQTEHGQAADHRADLYALGLVAYEVLTGANPFQRDTPEEIRAAHRHDTPKPLRKLRRDAPLALAAPVERLLAKRPEDRYESADALLADLERVSTDSDPSGRVILKRRPALLLVGAVAAAAAFVAFALPRLDNRESSAAAPLDQQNAIVDALPTSGNSDAKAEPVAQAEPSATTPLDAGVEREAQAESLAAASLDPKKVIVHTFVTPGDATPDAKAERVAQMASDWIVQGLVQTKLVTVMPVGPFAVNGSRRRAGAGSVDASLLLEARRAGAGHMITGRYHTVSDTVLLNVQIISTRDGAVVRAIGPVRASSDAPVDGAEQLRQRVLGSLATIVDARLAHWSSVATQPMNLAAYQAFSDGLAAFFDETSGRDPNVSFRRAHALDSTFTAPLLWALFRANKATSDSIFAYLTERRSTLPPWDQGVLDFFLRKNDEEGYQAFRRVVEVAPQSEWLYMLAWTARASGRPAVAVRALEQLDPNRGWMRNWPSYWSVLASAHHDLGHYEQELRAARLGLAKFPSSRGLQQAEIGALGALNRPIELQRALASISYHSPTVGTALPFFAPVISHLRRHGQLALADTVTDRLLRELDERRPAIPEPRLSRTRVWILWHARRWDEASVIVEQQLRNNPRDTDLTGLGAQIAAWRGNRAESERLALIYKAIADSVLKPGIWADRFYSGLRARLELLSGNRSAAIGILMSAEFGRNGEGADPSFESLYGDPSFEAIWRDYRDDPDVLPVRKSSKAGGSQHGMNRR